MLRVCLDYCTLRNCRVFRPLTWLCRVNLGHNRQIRQRFKDFFLVLLVISKTIARIIVLKVQVISMQDIYKVVMATETETPWIMNTDLFIKYQSFWRVYIRSMDWNTSRVSRTNVMLRCARNAERCGPNAAISSLLCGAHLGIAKC